MAIINGKFVPDNFAGSTQPQQGQTAPGFSSAKPPSAQMNQQTMNKGPQMGNVTPSNQMAAPLFANQNTMKVNQPSYQTMQLQRANQPQQLGARPAAPMGQPGRYNAQQPYQDPGFQGPQQAQQHAYQQPAMNFQQAPVNQLGQSIEQSVQSGNPQSVQNFLTALNKAGAGSNNTFMNAAGQQGQQAQGGFQGFGYNGQQAGPVAQMYSGPMGGQLGYAGNMAYGNYASPNSIKNYAQQGAAGQSGKINFGSQGMLNGTGAPAYDVNPTLNQIPKTNNVSAYNLPLFSEGEDGKPLFDPNINQNTPYGLDGNGQPYAPYGKGPDGKPIYIDPVTGDVWDPTIGADKPGQATSDQTAKQGIESGQQELEDFLSSLGVYSYEYKNKEYGEGRRISPMAQEIEKTPLGKIAISTNKEGYKQVDYGKLGGTMLAATAMLNNKVNKLAKQMQDTIAKNVSSKKKKG